MNEEYLIIKDRELIELIKKLVVRMGVNHEDLIKLAIRSFLEQVERREVERKFYDLLEKVERMSIAPSTSFSLTVVSEYLKELSTLKERMREMRELKEKANVIETLGYVELDEQKLRKLKRVIIRYCDTVVFKNDVKEETLNESVIRIYGVNKIIAPKRLHAIIATKAKICGRICEQKETQGD